MQKPATILVTGSTGQVGSELQNLSSSNPGYNFIFLNREQLPIENEEAVKKMFGIHQPQFIINCAAYTAVDKAEDEPGKAELINAIGVQHLAKYSEAYHSKFIHLSTDYVYKAKSKIPLKETDELLPLNIYGKTKLLGEQLAQQESATSVIIRTSWVYSFYGNNFVKTMIRLMNEKEQINVVNDQVGSPTHAADLAKAILHILTHKEWHPGIYNYSNEGEISWFQFAEEIKKLMSSSCQIVPVPSSEYVTQAQRPAYSVMDTSKIKKVFNLEIPNWKSSLQTCMHKLIHHQP